MSEHSLSILDVPEKDHIKVVYFSGEVDDTNLEKIKKTLKPIVEDEKIKGLVFYLRDLQFINSMVIQYFTSVYTHFHANKKNFVICEGNEHILDILTLVGFTKLVPHYKKLEKAIAAVEKA